eukprot:TRINITY_DN59988_c0_g1_i3.p3 TRINITY_DN59988_c0_g1~~TRINITY_DN59988_c0_g1_i3.p3  ORF type:complete len:103 (+),score=33.91 TRINITY_DN59988_c0_g1_i3:212-520(+)
MPSLLTIVAVKCRVLVDHFDGTYANCAPGHLDAVAKKVLAKLGSGGGEARASWTCLLYTSDAADEEDSVDLGGRRIIKKKKKKEKVTPQYMADVHDQHISTH